MRRTGRRSTMRNAVVRLRLISSIGKSTMPQPPRPIAPKVAAMLAAQKYGAFLKARPVRVQNQPGSPSLASGPAARSLGTSQLPRNAPTWSTGVQPPRPIAPKVAAMLAAQKYGAFLKARPVRVQNQPGSPSLAPTTRPGRPSFITLTWTGR
jgi:hypothetical protein